MKRFPASALAVLFAFATALPATAQEGFTLGVKAGTDSPSPSVATELRMMKSPESSAGFVVGLAAEGWWWRNLSVEGELLYVRRGTKNTYYGGSNDFGNYQGDVVADYTFTTLEIPLHVKYAFLRAKTTPFVFGGFSAAIPLKIESKNTAGSRTTTEDAKHQFRGAWWALEAGAGVDHRLHRDLSLLIEARYVYGITNAAALSSDSWKMRDLRVLGGVRLGL